MPQPELDYEALAQERRDLLQYVNAARAAIAALRPSEMRSRRLPNAMNEIGAIVETTESAANQIMGAVEEVLALVRTVSDGDVRSGVEARCMAILEACSFQDITGQRTSKVVETLLTIEDKLGNLQETIGGEADEDIFEPAEEILLNGPALPGEGVDQDEIDRLLADL